MGYAARRGVVAAASYEARVFGVRSAMPSTTALRQCPGLVFVPPRFEVYRAVSKRIQAIFADYTPLVEPLSLDEAYLDVTDNLRGLPTASETAVEIRARILEETGLTASAGISYNKFLAKLASDQRKPNGQFVAGRVGQRMPHGRAQVADLRPQRCQPVEHRGVEEAQVVRLEARQHMAQVGVGRGGCLAARAQVFGCQCTHAVEQRRARADRSGCHAQQ